MTRIAESLNLTLSAHGLLSDHFHKENSFLLCFCFKWVHTLPTKHHAHLETIWSDTCCSILEVINQTGLCNDNTCNDPGLKPGEGSSCDFLGGIPSSVFTCHQKGGALSNRMVQCTKTLHNTRRLQISGTRGLWNTVRWGALGALGPPGLLTSLNTCWQTSSSLKWKASWAGALWFRLPAAQQ